MAGPTKRTRASQEQEQLPTPSPSPPASSPAPRRRSAGPSTILTRSATTGHVPLTRSTSLFSPRSNGGTLVRTASTPIIPSPASLKGSSDPEIKGEYKHPGKGKENIPPEKDDSRKRIRTRRPSTRARSGSVSSMRSESARLSVASFSRVPSPSPSTRSTDTAASIDDAALPTPPSTPESDETVNPYKQVKAHLRLSASSTIIGRDDERKALAAYLAADTCLDVGMYVSGPPGTGKTATVSLVARESGRRVLQLGCMGLKPNDVWSRLAEQLACPPTEESVVNSLTTPTFILLDEVDSLLPPPPAVAPPATSHLLSKLFSLPTYTDGRVKLVAISNTLDLTLRARLVLPQGASPQVLPFKAYAGSDMINIIANRLAAVPSGAKIDPKAVELLTKKVEAQNGDLRTCLGILSSAVSLAEAEWVKKSDPAVLVKVSLPHIIRANNTHNLKLAAGSAATAVSATGKKIKSVPLQGKMVLVAALITRAKDTTLSSLYTSYVHLLSHHSSPIPPSSESDYRDLVSNLEVLGLVSLARTRGSPRIELLARDDEIKEGLGLNGTRGVAEDEVAKVWEREQARLERCKAKSFNVVAVE